MIPANGYITCTLSQNISAYTFPVAMLIGVSVCLCVCPVHCGITAGRIRMLFGTVSQTVTEMRQIVGFVDRSKGRVSFGGECRARHCNQ